MTRRADGWADKGGVESQARYKQDQNNRIRNNQVQSNQDQNKQDRNSRNLWNRSRGRQAGFTMIEMMVVIAIIGILAAIAIPNLVGSIRDREFNSSVQETLAMISNAKMRAISRNVNARVVFDNQSLEAQFRDNNGNWQRIGFHRIPPGVNINTLGFPNIDGVPGVVFTSRGLPDLAGGFAGGVINIASDRGLTRTIQINITGRVRS